jgi:hypothetical protein
MPIDKVMPKQIGQNDTSQYHAIVRGRLDPTRGLLKYSYGISHAKVIWSLLPPTVLGVRE